MMNSTLSAHLADQLAGLIERLIALHESIFRAIQAKLKAMREGDVDGMLVGARVESELIQQVERLSAERLDIVASLCSALNFPAPASIVSLRMFAVRLHGVQRERLMRLAGRLRERMVQVGEANRTV